jgi:membrane-bound serine protease (ClpP class)
MGIALRARRNKVVTGAQGLVGEIGVAHTALSPAGKVFVHGEIWDAVSPTPVAAGAKIVVREVQDLKLEVAEATTAEANPVATQVS